MIEMHKLTAVQEAELRRLQTAYPYRIVFAALKGEECQCWAVPSRRKLNALLRQGWTIVEVQR